MVIVTVSLLQFLSHYIHRKWCVLNVYVAWRDEKKGEKGKRPNDGGRSAPIRGVTMAKGVDVTMEWTPSISIGGSAAAARELGCVCWRSDTKN